MRDCDLLALSPFVFFLFFVFFSRLCFFRGASGRVRKVSSIVAYQDQVSRDRRRETIVKGKKSKGSLWKSRQPICMPRCISKEQSKHQNQNFTLKACRHWPQSPHQFSNSSKCESKNCSMARTTDAERGNQKTEPP